MAESQPAQVAILQNAHNFQIGEQRNYIINGNQYIYYNDQTPLTQLLQRIPDACHHRDLNISPPNSACFPGTRKNAIRMIVAWANSTLLWNTHVLWLHGFVGCGKSAIALAIALKFERKKRLVGSFFFFRNAGDRSRMARFAATLACQLASAISEAAPFIRKAVTDEPSLLNSGSVVAQLRRLVYEPFKAAAKQVGVFKTFLKPFLIVIDGLDECEDRNEVEAFIDDMLDFFKKNPLVPLRIFITSRVEQHIQRHLEKDQVRLRDLVNHCSRGDVDTFIRTCFEAEKRRNPVIKSYIRNHGEWPTKEDKDQLVDHIGGSFIFASALFNYIIDASNDQSTPMDRLPHTLNMNPDLDNLYASTLSRSQHLPHFPEVISTLAFMFEPLPIINIAELLEIEPFEVVRVLVNLQAIIHTPGTDDLPVTMCHTSLRDFLTTESRSAAFFVPPSYHLKLSYRYFGLNFRAFLSGNWIRKRSLLFNGPHFQELVGAMPESSVCVELDQLVITHLPTQPSAHLHLFSSTRLFFWVFEDSDNKPEQVLLILTKCIDSLASALESDPTPDKWIGSHFWQLMRYNYYYVRNGLVGRLEIHEEQAMALEHNIQRVEAAIGAKCPSSLSKPPWDPNIGQITTESWLSFWAVTDVYLLVKWITSHALAGVDPAEPGVPCVLDLQITSTDPTKPWSDSPVIISIQAVESPQSSS